MINLFGTTIEAPPISDGHYFDSLLVAAAKKENERRMLKDFLLGDSLAGRPRLGEIVIQAQNEALFCSNPLDFKSQAIEFYLSQLKQTGIYERMVLELISRDHVFRSADIANQLLKGKSPKLPDYFPGDHKQAESLVVGALSSSIGDKECQQYLTRKLVKARIQEIAKDLFFAINHGLDPEQTTRFLSIIYELNQIKAADFTNTLGIKNNILTAILTGHPLQLIHIKCLRFTYPHGNRLKLLTHIGVDNSPVNFSRRPQSEQPIFDRLKHLSDLFLRHRINTNFLILVSDQDILDYFPNGGQGFVPDQDLEIAHQDLELYRQAVADSAPFATVELFRKFLALTRRIDSFDHQRKTIISQLKSGRSALPENYVESKVDYRYKSNTKIFSTCPPDRNFARTRVYAQVASLQSLAILGSDVILIEEDHGNDNQYIGGHKSTALPVIFTKLKDSTQIIPKNN